jgi:ribosome-associated protein
MTAPPAIPAQDLEISFVRATGPGGQNVNKVSSAAQLRFNLAGTALLDPAAKARLAVLAGQRLNADGWIQIVARTQRTQEGNRREAMARLQALIDQARIVPKKRRPTRPTRASQIRRVESKIARQQSKKLRGRVRTDD